MNINSLGFQSTRGAQATLKNNSKINEKRNATTSNLTSQNASLAFKAYTQEFRLPTVNPTPSKSVDDVFNAYSDKAKAVVADFKTRAGKKGQFLNWVNLPAEQLKENSKGVSHVDEIYSQVAKLKEQSGDYPLVVLGIGGSKHTNETLLNLSGVGNKGKVYFYSDIDSLSRANFEEEIGGDLSKANYLVVSKWGTTFETKDAFMRFQDNVEKSIKGRNKKSEAEKHFAIATDATATEKNLRGVIGHKNGVNNNFIKELYIHDDVGGRYSVFDDPGIFVMAYAGVDKDVTKAVLKGAKKMSAKALNENVKQNPAIKAAIFDSFSQDNNYNITVNQAFGHVFESGFENWSKQLYLESLKDFNYHVGKAPDSMHYASENHFKDDRRTSYNTVMTTLNLNPKKDPNYTKYIGAIAEEYNLTTPLLLEKLDVKGKGVDPETIGEFMQERHFETVYKGMLRREVNGEKQPAVLDEILQPNVEKYKNRFKEGQYKLEPGAGA